MNLSLLSQGKFVDGTLSCTAQFGVDNKIYKPDQGAA